MAWTTWRSAWIAEWGDDSLTSAEQRHDLLHLHPDIDVDIMPLERSVVLKSTLSPLPSYRPDTLIAQAMEANLFGRGTRGAVIALNEEGTLLTLLLEVEYTETYRAFKERLEDFVSVVVFWRNAVLTHRA